MKKRTLHLEKQAHKLGLRFHRLSHQDPPVTFDFFYDQRTVDVNLRRENSHVSIDSLVRRAIHHFIPPPQPGDYKKFITTAPPQLRSLSSHMAFLFAHGDTYNGAWVYQGDKPNIPVQQFIDSIDGRYGLIFLHSCNPGKHKVTSQHSAIVVPNDAFSYGDLLQEKVQLQLFIPTRGYVGSRFDDTSYSSFLRSL